jgi:hypothetical protein
MVNKQHYLPAVAIWGVVFGIVCGIPALNCCCFLWFPLAGLLTVMNVSSKANATVGFAEGAVLGLITGGIAGVIAGILGGGVNALMGSAMLDFYRSMPSIPPETLAQFEAMYANPAGSFFQSCCLFTIIGPMFGAVGGLIGSPIFKKDGGGGGAMPQPRAF